jgi:hypothetical protein
VYGIAASPPAEGGHEVARRFTHVRLAGGTGLEHIVRLWWTTDGGKTGDASRGELVTWIEDGGKAYVVGDDGTRADVEVVAPAHGPKYLKSKPDASKRDNLLALPRK